MKMIQLIFSKSFSFIYQSLIIFMVFYSLDFYRYMCALVKSKLFHIGYRDLPISPTLSAVSLSLANSALTMPAYFQFLSLPSLCTCCTLCLKYCPLAPQLVSSFSPLSLSLNITLSIKHLPTTLGKAFVGLSLPSLHNSLFHSLASFLHIMCVIS